MGNIGLRNRFLESMSDELENSDVDIDVDDAMALLDVPEEEDEMMNESEFASILRQLIRSYESLNRFSGDIMVLNYENFLQNPLPVIKRKPNLDRLKKNAIYHATKSASEAGAAGSSDAPDSIVRMLNNRQFGLGERHGPFMRSTVCRINNHFRPNAFVDTVQKCDMKVFCGKFTGDGNQFITASQDTMIRVYDSSQCQYRLQRTMEAKHVSWSILDVDFSPDGQSFVYSTWADAVFVASLDNLSSDGIQCLYLNSESQKLGVFSVCYSSCGKHILCGANYGYMFAYDLNTASCTLKAPISTERPDVNAVGFVDESSNIFFSGSDHGIIKLWDRRCMNESNPEAVGKLVGHSDGITFIDSRNDGRYIISNSKDQSIKLWDLRHMSPATTRRNIHYRNWDYRWDDVPKRFFNAPRTLSGDTSIVTFRGHKVQKSLIRAKFSPALTTGQRYIYTGCGTGRLILYDVLTGAIVEAIEGHHDIVRDVAWHPHRAEILTCSWDTTVHRHTYRGPEEKDEDLGNKARGSDDRRMSHNSDDDSDDDKKVQRPTRRSLRIAERNNGRHYLRSSASNKTTRRSTRN
ncbi:DDB1- and CUL4-associated factor 11 isoform X1 [Anopheles bellator]|uniref:DDB1- and CUL4-associated factor 11 isoform X1 n=1 Tax=Anopheles bellator TaxID=139047 RepID=UPI002647356D|nr:DDB1- and CUL4-associated factor 11 isoform X1 [Anopheles bellator]